MIKGIKNYCNWLQYYFCFHQCLTTEAFKKVQYGYHGKNGVFSDHTERTYSEMYSSNSCKYNKQQKTSQNSGKNLGF